MLKADANSRSAQFVTLWGGKEHWRQAVGIVHIDSRLPDDTAVARVTRAGPTACAAGSAPSEWSGRTAIPIDARDALSRRQESVLGDLVTDAARAGTGSDVALINAGAMRLDDVIPPGPITNYQVESIFLFADDTRMVTFPLTRRPTARGAGARRVRRLAGQGRLPPGLGRHLHLRSGKARRWSRIVGDIRRKRPAARSGPGTRSAVTFPAYPGCHGGDGYSVPEAQPACAGEKSAPRAADLLARYVTDSLKGKVEAPAAGRIIRAGNTNPG